LAHGIRHKIFIAGWYNSSKILWLISYKILNDCKDVKYQANNCLPFIIIKVSLNKGLTHEMSLL